MLAVTGDTENREFFAKVSVNLGISCDVAASGEEAAGLMDSGKNYDIYFLDYELTGVNGIELTRQIRGKATRRCVIVILSSREWNVVEDEAHDVSIDKVISKPLFQSAIVDAINEFIGSKKTLKHAEHDDAFDDFSGHTILLAEDVEINREIVLTLLEPTHLAVECAENGAQAAKMFEDAPDKYDMIFMDVQMPEMDGYEATRRIRASGVARSKSIPIVAMTANVFREDVTKCLDAGMNAHVGKPFNIDEVVGQLRKYLVPER